MMAQSRAESTWDIYSYGKIQQSIPAEYDKSNTTIWTDQQENM